MEYGQLGKLWLNVSALSFGAATFSSNSDFFEVWGSSADVEQARAGNEDQSIRTDISVII